MSLAETLYKEAEATAAEEIAALAADLTHGRI